MKRTVLGPMSINELSLSRGLNLKHSELEWIRIGQLTGRINENTNFGRFLKTLSLNDKVKITIERL